MKRISRGVFLCMFTVGNAGVGKMQGTQQYFKSDHPHC